MTAMTTVLASTKEALQEQLDHLADSYRMTPSIWTWNAIMQVKQAMTETK
jgi:predicted transcriptional regulator